MLKTTLFAGCFLSAPLLARAQTEAAPAPRYYVGLAAFSSDFQSLSGGGYRSTAVPVQLTGGYQLRPRLAGQLSGTYSGYSGSYSEAGQYQYGPGVASPYRYYEAETSFRQRTLSLAPLLRYTLTRTSTHRFQADVLGGFTLVHYWYSSHYAQTTYDSTRTTAAVSRQDWQRQQTDLLLTAGIGLRYRLSRRVEALYELTLHRNLLAGGTGLAAGMALGARYRFGGLR